MSHYPPSDIDVFASSSFSLLIQKEELEEIILLDLHTSCLIGDYDSVRAYIDSNVDLNKINIGGWTPLMYAAYVGRDNILNMLLDAGANVDIHSTRNGVTALMLASYCASESIMYFLLQNGATIDAQDANGLTSLFHAVKQGHLSAVKLLVSNGAQMDLCHYQSGMTPLMEAAMMGNEAIFGVLLDHGADINRYNKNGDSVRSLALKYGHTTIVTLCDKMTYRLGTGAPLRSDPDLGNSDGSSDQNASDLMAGPNMADEIIRQQREKTGMVDMGAGGSSRSSSSESKRFLSQPSEVFFPTVEDILRECDQLVHLEKFQSQGIDFHTFLQLSDVDLKEIGVDKMGPRRKIMIKIDGWKQKLRNQSHGETADMEQMYNAQVQELNTQLQKSTAMIHQLKSAVNAKQEQLVAYAETLKHMVFYVTDIGNSCDEAKRQMNKIRNFHEKIYHVLHNIKSHQNFPDIANQLGIPSTIFDDANSVKQDSDMLLDRLKTTRQQAQISLDAIRSNRQSRVAFST